MERRKGASLRSAYYIVSDLHFARQNLALMSLYDLSNWHTLGWSLGNVYEANGLLDCLGVDDFLVIA